MMSHTLVILENKSKQTNEVIKSKNYIPGLPQDFLGLLFPCFFINFNTLLSLPVGKLEAVPQGLQQRPES